MKNILIVHTENASRKKHFTSARQYGAKLILVKRNPTWETDSVDDVITVDTRSIEKTVAAVKAYNEKNKIDGVVTFVEHSVPTAAAVAEALGLPYISVKTAELARNKYEMRQVFFQHGIPCPQFALAKNLPEALQIGQRFKYPVVLKPLIGGGSMYIRRVNSPEEMSKYFDLIQQGAWAGFDYDPLYESAYQKYQGAILIESYLDGGEVSVESIVVDGETNILAIHDKPLPMVGPYFEEVYFTTPTRLDKKLQAELKKWTKKSNEALGIHIGATHTEFRLTTHGPVILETAARMGGGPVYRSILTSTGIDMVHAIMDLSLKKIPKLAVENPIPTGFRLIFAENEGVIQKIDGIPTLENDPHVIEIEMYKKIGDSVLLPPRIFQAHGHMIVKHHSLEELDKKVDELVQHIQIKIG